MAAEAKHDLEISDTLGCSRHTARLWWSRFIRARIAGIRRDAAGGGRKPVFEDPNGVGWCMSVSYNAGLERYLLSTEHTSSFQGNLGIFDAPEPWGPWTTVEYTPNWGNGHVSGHLFYWNFSNKWTSGDGKNTVFVFSGTGEADSWNLVKAAFEAASTPAIRYASPGRRALQNTNSMGSSYNLLGRLHPLVHKTKLLFPQTFLVTQSK